MPGLSLRALLCCSARVGDNDDLELPKIPPPALVASTGSDGGTTARGVEDTARAIPQGVDTITPVNQLHAPSQSEGEKEHLNQGSKSRSWNIALEGGVLILTLTKGILGNFSFPGTDVAFNVALAIVRNVKTSKDNAEKLEMLRTRMDGLQSSIPSDLSGVQPESQEMFLRFKSKIEETIVPLAKLDKKAGVMKIFLADLDKQKLDRLSDAISNAVELLSVQTFQATQQAHERQDEAHKRQDEAHKRLEEDHERQDKAHERQEDSLQDIGRKVDSEKLEKAVNRLPRTAAYDSQRTRPIDVCYEGTCGVILSRVKTWASADVADEKPGMFWLSGLAGTGKSTVAKTIATWADREGLLGSSYFFSRDVEELSKSSLVIPMLAYQLSKSHIDPSFTKRVSEMLVEDDSRVLYQEIAMQFRKLIEEPLQSLHVPSTPRKRMLIVIDALDECSDRSDAGKIISLLLQQLSASHSHLCVFLISRPEPHILDALQLENQPRPTVARIKVEDFVQTSDIEIYLRHELANLGPTDWPDIDEFNALVQKSGRLFIYASTAVKYIRGGRALGNPVERLRTLLSMNPGEASEDAPYKQLDDLYLRIFIEAVEDDKQVDSKAMVRFRRIVGTLVRLRNPLPINSLASLLEEDEQDIRRTLEYLGSIIIVPSQNDRDTPPRFFHPSLPEFLTDANRCADKRFFIDVPQFEGYVSQCCLRVMIAKFPEMIKGKGRSLSVLRYACTHWAVHLETTHHEYVEIKEDLLKFIRCHLRDWLKARKMLSLERFIYRSIWSMEVAQAWLAQSNRNDKLENIFRENFRLLLDEVLPQARGASYDSVKLMRRIEACHPGTRTAILEQIKDWATRLHPKSPTIFWLCESGGTGKSAVAISIAEWGSEDSFLGGSFFFDRQAPQVDLRSIIRTIAHDLALFDTSMRSSITQALDNDQTSFEDLVAVPLTKRAFHDSILLVIDALDECDDQTATEIINLVFTLSDDNPRVRMLLTSRPESHICAAFAPESKQNFIKQSVNPEDSEYGDSHEIETYLYTGLSKISGEAEWRERDDFRALVEYCGNLFVHATTALRYINHRGGDIETRIAALLIHDTDSMGETPYDRLNRFYMGILGEYFGGEATGDSEEVVQSRRILGMVSELRDTLPMSALSELLGMDEASLRNRLKGLRPVISIPGRDTPDTPVRFFHRSFSDFLKGDQKAKTGQFFIDAKDLQTCLAQRCLEAMIEGSPGNSSKMLTPGLRYASKYWAEHLAHVHHGDAHVIASLETFVWQRYLLNWFTVNFVDLDHLKSSLTQAYNWTVRSRCTEELSETINGMLRFVLFEIRARSQSHNSEADVCYNGTCGAILSKVKDWATCDVTDGQTQMFWLSGVAGSGKSTVMRTISTWAKKEGLPYCSSSYWIKDDGRVWGKFSYIIPYVAYHISKIDDSVADSVTKALVEVGVLYHGIEVQSQGRKPPALHSLQQEVGYRNPILIAIDALDECEDKESAQSIINFFAILTTLSPHIRAFIASRPEWYIRAAFDEVEKRWPSTLTRCAIEDFVGTGDIEEYLRHELTNGGQPDSPGEDDIDKLVAKCKGLFVYASTANRFIRKNLEPGHLVERLKLILNLDSGGASEEASFKHLDDLYMCILSEAARNDGQADFKSMGRLRRILGAMALLHEPQSIGGLARILEDNQEQMEVVVKQYCTTNIITTISSCFDEVELLFFPHISLSHFLTDAKRCSDERFLIDIARLETDLFRRSLDIITEGLVTTSAKVDRTFRRTMIYACLHWAKHLEKSHHKNAQVAKKLCHFVHQPEGLLRWFMVAKYLLYGAETGDLYTSLRIARNWAALAECDEETIHIIDSVTRSSKTLLALLPESDRVLSYSRVKFSWHESCFVGTRVAILKEIQEWTTNLDRTTPNIFWLSGPLEVGKTSIAMSVADWANEKGILVGGLFLRGSRTSGVRNILSAIACEIASFDKSIRNAIVKALERNTNLTDMDLEMEFERLIAEPLLLTKINSPILLIIDDLHKLEEEEAVEVLKLFLTRLSGPECSKVRIMVSSRSEPHICNTFEKHEQLHRSFDLTRISASDVHQEIKFCLFNELSQVHEKLGLSRPNDWPDRRDLDSLFSNSGGFFCYARRALDFICDHDSSSRDPAKYLRIWLDYPTEVHSHFSSCRLEDFYQLGLQSVVVSDIQLSYDVVVRMVAVIVLLQEPLALDSQADLLQLDQSNLQNLLLSFHPIIICPNDTQASPRPFHPSLRVYLTDKHTLRKHRLNRFFVDTPKQEAYLCRRCLEIIEEGLCHVSGVDTIGGGGGGILSGDELGGKSDAILSPILRYACTYWSAHLSKADSRDSLLEEVVENFVRNYLFIWMEAMVLLGLTQNFSTTLQAAYEWTINSGCAEDVHDILREAIQFAEKNLDVIAESPLQIWRSLLDLPENSPLRRSYETIAVERLKVADESNHVSDAARTTS